MARPLCYEAAGAVNHVMARGDGGLVGASANVRIECLARRASGDGSSGKRLPLGGQDRQRAPPCEAGEGTGTNVKARGLTPFLGGAVQISSAPVSPVAARAHPPPTAASLISTHIARQPSFFRTDPFHRLHQMK